jgi:hypothetical protein
MSSPRGVTVLQLFSLAGLLGAASTSGLVMLGESVVLLQVAETKVLQRDLAMAIEAYRVDWGIPPITSQWIVGPGAPAPPAFDNRLRGLTTPVAYIDDLPTDPFAPPDIGSVFPYTPADRPTFEYEDVTTAVRGLAFPNLVDFNLFTNIAAWHDYYVGGVGTIDYAMHGLGPDERNDFQQLALPLNSGPTTIVLGVNQTYDPTNGLVSRGDIRWTSADPL